MLSTTLSTDERITTAHRAKLAYVYVRQSSPGQVRHHTVLRLCCDVAQTVWLRPQLETIGRPSQIDPKPPVTRTHPRYMPAVDIDHRPGDEPVDYTVRNLGRVTPTRHP